MSPGTHCPRVQCPGGHLEGGSCDTMTPSDPTIIQCDSQWIESPAQVKEIGVYTRCLSTLIFLLYYGRKLRVHTPLTKKGPCVCTEITMLTDDAQHRKILPWETVLVSMAAARKAKSFHISTGE